MACVAILAVWVVLRFYAFWLPHWKGDQGHYISLAMKLDKRGLDGYNLREVDLKFARFTDAPSADFIFPALSSQSTGNLLTVLKAAGQGYYDEPLHMRAPGFAFILLGSHRLFLAGTSLLSS